MTRIVSFLDEYREFRCGGDGTVGYVQLHGLCMDWLHHSLEIYRTHYLTKIKRWNNSWMIILDSNMISWEWLQLWLLGLWCCSYSSLPTPLRHLTSKGDKKSFGAQVLQGWLVLLCM